jgi:hypothetical protein
MRKRGKTAKNAQRRKGQLHPFPRCYLPVRPPSPPPAAQLVHHHQFRSSCRRPWPPQEFDQQAALDSALEDQAAKDPDDVFGVVEDSDDISSCRAAAESFLETIFGAEKIMDPPFQLDSEDSE